MKARFERQRTGDHDTLPLAAGKLVRKTIDRIARQPNQRQQLFDAIVAVAPCAPALDVDRLGDRVADPHARVQRGVGVLEHELRASTNGGELSLAVGSRDVTPEQLHGSGSRLDHTNNDAPRRRFAGPGFANQTQRLALSDLEAHAAQHPQQASAARAAAQLERHVDVAGFDKRRERHQSAP